RLRSGLKLSQVAAAEQMGIARTMLSMMEGASWNPTVGTLEKVCAVYEIGLSDLFRPLPNIGPKLAVKRRIRSPSPPKV
ncbi:MAG: hypothetical protein JWP57_4383, partial [Spirosoma sp.]|nr:hypothetical protein [Spirosoma sp.]